MNGMVSMDVLVRMEASELASQEMKVRTGIHAALKVLGGPAAQADSPADVGACESRSSRPRSWRRRGRAW